MRSRRVIHDCARRLRVRYALTRPLHEALIEHFSGGTLDVQRFSELVAGAHDHLTITVGGALLLRGVLGQRELEVTYGKIAGAWPTTLVTEVEQRLEAFEAAPMCVAHTETSAIRHPTCLVS